MKQKDIALILVVVIASGVVSFGISHLLFGGAKNRQQRVEVVTAITSDFSPPEARYFNAQSINPTQLISITENANKTPFNGQ